MSYKATKPGFSFFHVHMCYIPFGVLVHSVLFGFFSTMLNDLLVRTSLK